MKLDTHGLKGRDFDPNKMGVTTKDPLIYDSFTVIKKKNYKCDSTVSKVTLPKVL